MSEKYNIEELIVRFLQQDINEDELRYLKSWLAENVCPHREIAGEGTFSG